MTPTSNPQPPLVISEEARASYKRLGELCKRPQAMFTEDKFLEHLQLAINQATEKLTKENKALRHQIAIDFMAGVVIEKDKEIQTLTTRIKELEEENLKLKRAFQDEFQKDL